MCGIKDPHTGKIHHDPFEVLEVWRTYYQVLFTAEAYINTLAMSSVIKRNDGGVAEERISTLTNLNSSKELCTIKNCVQS